MGASLPVGFLSGGLCPLLIACRIDAGILSKGSLEATGWLLFGAEHQEDVPGIIAGRCMQQAKMQVFLVGMLIIFSILQEFVA